MMAPTQNIDMVILRISEKRYIGKFLTLVKYIDSLAKDKTEKVIEFSLSVPRPNFEFAPHRFKFHLSLTLSVENTQYHRFVPKVSPSELEQDRLHLFLKESTPLSAISKAEDFSPYRF